MIAKAQVQLIGGPKPQQVTIPIPAGRYPNVVELFVTKEASWVASPLGRRVEVTLDIPLYKYQSAGEGVYIYDGVVKT